jgi:anti-sigma regulatory factor (Ser/Thr protein kinase)
MHSLSAIRDFVDKWGTEVGLSEERRYRLKVAVCEACANAVEHSGDESDLSLWAWERDDRFTVDVWHAGEFRAKADKSPRHGGVGLPLMLACADEVSFAYLPEGGTRVSLSMFLKRETHPDLRQA